MIKNMVQHGRDYFRYAQARLKTQICNIAIVVKSLPFLTTIPIVISILALITSGLNAYFSFFGTQRVLRSIFDSPIQNK
jgi:hypothetical protein